MAALDFNEIALSVQWVSAAWALQKLAAASGASRGSALANLKHVYETGEVTFRGGAPFRWRTMTDLAALNDPYRVPRPEVPLPSDELRIFDQALRQTYKLTTRDGEVIAAPRSETAPQIAWVMSCLTDDLRKQWPLVFAPIVDEVAPNRSKEEPPPSFKTLSGAIKHIIEADPSLPGKKPNQRDEIIENRLSELGVSCSSVNSLKRNIQAVLKAIEEQNQR